MQQHIEETDEQSGTITISADEQSVTMDQGTIDKINEILAEGDIPLEPLAGELANTAAQYDAAAVAERRNENPDGVFESTYDPQIALRAIFRLKGEVDTANINYLASKEQTAKLKSEYDARVKALTALIEEVKQRDANARNPQPVLRTIEETQDENIWERKQRLSKELETRQAFIDPADMADLTREDLDTLDLWVRKPGPLAPALIERSCIANREIDGEQRCTKCGDVVAVAPVTIPEGAFVGLHCPGTQQAVTPEPKKQRGDPDQERSAQAEDGKKRTMKKGKKG